MHVRRNLSGDTLLRHPLNIATCRGLAPTLLAALVASLLPFSVAAQDAQQPQVIEEVVVTGYRQSILNAIDAKRMADTVAETLSADDLGSLPDVSMADALTRLPGIRSVSLRVDICGGGLQVAQGITDRRRRRRYC